jgi:hypothetical protein
VSVRIKSEGALGSVEETIARYEKIEQLLEQPVELVANALPSANIDLEAVARLERLDPVPARRLEEVCKRVAERTRRQLRERDIEPTALRVEDLLAQLIARANMPRRPKDRPRLRLAAVVLLTAGAVSMTLWLESEGYPWLGLVPLVTIAALCALLSLRHDN